MYTAETDTSLSLNIYSDVLRSLNKKSCLNHSNIFDYSYQPIHLYVFVTTFEFTACHLCISRVLLAYFKIFSWGLVYTLQHHA
jgi:hypothetical protein